METQVLVVVVVVVSVGGKRVGGDFFQKSQTATSNKKLGEFSRINGYDMDIMEQS